MPTNNPFVLHFSGTGNIDLGIQPSFLLGSNLTIEAWVNIAAQTRYAGLLSKIYDTSRTQSGYGLLLDGASGVYACVSASSIKYLSSGANSVPLNEWHHVATTYDGSTIRLYVDGVQTATWNQVTGPIDNQPNHNMRIGSYVDDNETHHFSGKLAELRLWQIVRSREEIIADYQYRLRGDEPGLVAYWPLDEGSGTSIHDRTDHTPGGALGTGINWQEDPTLPVHSRLSPELDFQHAWLGTSSDYYGDIDLQGIGSPAQGVTVSGLKDTPFTRAAFEFQEKGTSAWVAPSEHFDFTDQGDAAESVLIAGLFRTLTAAPLDGQLLGFVGKREHESPYSGWEVGLDSHSQLLAQIKDDEADIHDGRVSLHVRPNNVKDAQWHTFVLVYNKHTNELSLCTASKVDGQVETQQSTPPTSPIPGDCSSSVGMSIGANRLKSCGSQIAFIAVATGSAVESVSDYTQLAASLCEAYVD